MMYINMPVKGINTLVIEVNDVGKWSASDRGIIVNPRLTRNNVKLKINANDISLKLGE